MISFRCKEALDTLSPASSLFLSLFLTSFKHGAWLSSIVSLRGCEVQNCSESYKADKEIMKPFLEHLLPGWLSVIRNKCCTFQIASPWDAAYLSGLCRFCKAYIQIHDQSARAPGTHSNTRIFKFPSQTMDGMMEARFNFELCKEVGRLFSQYLARRHREARDSMHASERTSSQ